MEYLWQFETENYIVGYRAEPEQEDPADAFGFQEDIDAVRNGLVDWFVAIVEVTHKPTGRVLGTDYLGGCAYKSASDFCEGEHRDYYFRDMVLQAIVNARQTANVSYGVKP